MPALSAVRIFSLSSDQKNTGIESASAWDAISLSFCKSSLTTMASGIDIVKGVAHVMVVVELNF